MKNKNQTKGVRNQRNAEQQRIDDNETDFAIIKTERESVI